ncbi:hypothetical protein AXX17_AT1G74310 [Arabidopsis thaliana]|uniref:Uncharacterized protein n=1 Tax=Arabidopsis thaliana TaxID=3702 RepID=A0A178W4E0_ARATH|nr:hypothetical protein AXX17_AT1G74310 [Arabidopsis thaliana]
MYVLYYKPIDYYPAKSALKIVEAHLGVTLIRVYCNLESKLYKPSFPQIHTSAKRAPQFFLFTCFLIF